MKVLVVTEWKYRLHLADKKKCISMGFDRRRVLLVQVWVIYWHVFFDADKEKSCNIIIRRKSN